VLGPHTWNFAEAAQSAIALGAARSVASAAAVDEALRLMGDAPAREAMQQAALAFAHAHQGATERTVAALGPLLPMK